MYFPSSIESAKCCFGQTLGQAYRRMVIIDLAAFIYAIAQFITHINGPGDKLMVIIGSLLCLASASLQILIGGISQRRKWPNENGRFSRYYLTIKLIYLITFILNNSLFKLLVCKDIDESLDQPSCDYTGGEICVMVIWSLIHLCLLQVIATVCKYIQIENAYGNRETSAREDLEDPESKIFEAEIVEAVGIPYTIPKRGRVITTIPLNKKSVSKVPKNVEKFDLMGEDGGWKSPEEIKQDRSASPRKEMRSQQPDSEGVEVEGLEERRERRSPKKTREDRLASPVREKRSQQPDSEGIEVRSSEERREQRSPKKMREDRFASPVREKRSQQPDSEGIEVRGSEEKRERKSPKKVREDRMASPVREKRSQQPDSEGIEIKRVDDYKENGRRAVGDHNISRKGLGKEAEGSKGSDFMNLVEKMFHKNNI